MKYKLVPHYTCGSTGIQYVCLQTVMGRVVNPPLVEC